MGSPQLQVQRAAYQLLTADSVITSLAGVYDQVPENRVFPYVVVGDVTDRPMDSFSSLGRLAILTISAWSQYPGFAHAFTLASQIIIDLDRVTLPGFVGYASVRCQYKGCQTRVDMDGLSREVRVQFDVYAETLY